MLILITVPTAPFAAYHCPAAALTVVVWLMKKCTTAAPFAVITYKKATTRVLGEALKAGGCDGCDGGESWELVAQARWKTYFTHAHSLCSCRTALAARHYIPMPNISLECVKKKKSFCSGKVQFYVWACKWVLLNVPQSCVDQLSLFSCFLVKMLMQLLPTQLAATGVPEDL